MSSLPHSTGQALDRVDGPAKVTGQARYAAEYPAADLLHGSVVSSDVAHGRVRGIDCAAALAVPGVVAVLHHLNRPPMAGDDEPYKDADAAEGEPFRPLFDDRVLYSGQPLPWSWHGAWNWPATRARCCASISSPSRTRPTCWPPSTRPMRLPPNCPRARRFLHRLPRRADSGRGQLQHADRAPQSHGTARVHGHRPARRQPAGARQDPGDAEQPGLPAKGLRPARRQGKGLCRLRRRRLRLRPASAIPVGPGGDGGAATAAVGARSADPPADVHLRLPAAHSAAPATGRRCRGCLLALGHQATAQTSRFEDFTEHVVEWSGMLYRCENLSLAYRLVPLDVYTPLDMRAPARRWD